ncbi:SMC-Scp complex subunit ScpB [Candidatus Woesearchaeota archaeon]|nr:SMC-Scp complex subunit ScpB [Candidatus Woesearchaeota archaeon]
MTQEKEVMMEEEPKGDYKNKIEALLFSAGKKLEVDFMRDTVGARDKRPIKKALEELKEDYDKKDSSLMLVEDGDSWKLNVREKYLPLVRKIVAETELTKTVMETLAVIAWKSPVLQSEVIHIRTNKAYEHVGELLEAGFITKERHGRSYMLKVTQKFYEYFDVDGAQGIRDVFAKIKEKPEQKKVDEFKEVVKEAGDEMETEKLGELEVFDEKSEEQETKEDVHEGEVEDEEPEKSEDDNTQEELEETAKEVLEDELTDEDKEVLEDQSSETDSSDEVEAEKETNSKKK